MSQNTIILASHEKDGALFELLQTTTNEVVTYECSCWKGEQHQDNHWTVYPKSEEKAWVEYRRWL